MGEEKKNRHTDKIELKLNGYKGLGSQNCQKGKAQALESIDPLAVGGTATAAAHQANVNSCVRDFIDYSSSLLTQFSERTLYDDIYTSDVFDFQVLGVRHRFCAINVEE